MLQSNMNNVINVIAWQRAVIKKLLNTDTFHCNMLIITLLQNKHQDCDFSAHEIFAPLIAIATRVEQTQHDFPNITTEGAQSITT